MNWITNKKVIVISLLGLLIQIVSRFSVDLGVCHSYADKCADTSYLFVVYSFIFVPFFIFSLIFQNLKESIFKFWAQFSFYSIILYFIAILLLPVNTYGFDVFPIDKGFIAIALSVIYSIISLIIIIYKSLKKNK